MFLWIFTIKILPMNIKNALFEYLLRRG